MVALTSVVRRISPKEETVGGPIDVAIISKGDGFIWKNRKHYFDPNMNTHFFDDNFRTYLMDTLFHTTNALDDKNNDIYNTANIIAEEVAKV